MKFMSMAMKMLLNRLQRSTFSRGASGSRLHRRCLSRVSTSDSSHRPNNLGRLPSHCTRSFAATAPTTVSKSDGDTTAPLRRRRKPSRSSNATSLDGDDDMEKTSATTSTDGAFFAPVDPKTGQLLTSDQYLKLASLSPWVPCPDVVSKRVFEIASASNTDIHVDLGCGDGRLNFMAVDSPTSGVKKSWGVDVDENILKKCYERLGRRFVPSMKNESDVEGNGGEMRLEFVKADLIKVIERQKKLYQQEQQRQRRQQQQEQQQVSNHDSVVTNQDESSPNNNDLLQSITEMISNSTIITMYFVDNALQQIQPYLASILGGKKNVRVITIGYEMPSDKDGEGGWKASWVERVLGLTIFRYDMENVSRFPSDWNDDGGDDNATDGEESGGGNGVCSDVSIVERRLDDSIDDQESVEEFLRRKWQEDIEDLNRGLRIHHDEELNDFAHARAKKMGQDSSSSLVWEDDEDAWEDFDETEEPEELMKEAQRKMIEARKSDRGKMMVGVGEGKKSSSTVAASKKLTWKKP